MSKNCFHSNLDSIVIPIESSHAAKKTPYSMDYSHIERIEIYKELVMVLSIDNDDNRKLTIINIKTKLIDFQVLNISCFCPYEDKIVMGSYNESTIRILNLGYTELMAFQNCFDSRGIERVQITDNYLIGLTRHFNQDSQACIFNIETKTKLYHIEHLLMPELRIYLNQNMLVYLCPNEDLEKIQNPLHATLKCCDLDSGECIFDYYEESIKSISHDFFILHESLKGSFKLRSIKLKTIVSDLTLPTPRKRNTYLAKSKSKLAYFNTSITNSFKCSLKIINFEPTMDI